MLFLKGILKCDHEACLESADIEVPAQGNPVIPEGWLSPESTVAFCPAHVSDYTPPHVPTEEEVRAELKAMGLPDDLIEAMVAENRRR